MYHLLAASRKVDKHLIKVHLGCVNRAEIWKYEAARVGEDGGRCDSLGLFKPIQYEG
jgi:hypothetical protein